MPTWIERSGAGAVVSIVVAAVVVVVVSVVAGLRGGRFLAHVEVSLSSSYLSSCARRLSIPWNEASKA